MVVTEEKFSFNIPMTIQKSDDGMKISGIAATEHKDFQNEIIKVDGLDISSLPDSGFFNEDHKKGFQHILGKVQKAEKREDSELGKHLYVEGNLFESQPAAKSAYNIMNELEKAGNKKQMQMSVEGSILKRTGSDKKTIAKAKVKNIALTLNPINNNTFASLMKSFSGCEMGEVPDPEEKVFIGVKKGTYNRLVKALAVGHPYAEKTPSEFTGGDVMTQESLERKKKRKKKMKEVLMSVKKSYPDVPIEVIFDIFQEKYKKAIKKGE